jgi:hypothetical protein
MSIKTLLQRATVMCAFLLATASGASANLLGNPGFESPVIPGGGPPEYYGAGDAWTSFGGGIFTVGAAVAPPHTGNQSLKTFGGCCSGAFQEFPASAGDTWNGGVWMLNFSGDPMGGGQVAAVNIEWHGPGGLISFISNGTFTAASPRDVWTLQTVTGIAPPGTTFARLVVITGDFQPGGPAGAPFFDDAFFELIPPTPTLPSTWGKLKTLYR